MFPILELKQLSKTFVNEKVLDNINLSIYKSEFISILGPSGSGKTTLLRLIGGFEKADTGSIFMNNTEIQNIPPQSRKINTVFQNYALFPHMNVYQNIEFGLKISKQKKSIIKEEVENVIHMVGLENFIDRMPDQLSGGQKQRVAIARAIVKKPNILLLDEPLSALDKKLREKMQIKLKHLQKNLGITFILVTHDQEEALSVADRVVVMNNGHIEQIGKPRDVYETPENLFVAKFIGDINIFSAEVIEQKGKNITLIIEKEIKYKTQYNKKLKPNKKVKVLFRPEDLKIEIIKKNISNKLIGHVDHVTYKGSTLESVVELTNGKKIKIKEFFDEDDEDFDYKIGEMVAVNWIDGWEVIIENED